MGVAGSCVYKWHLITGVPLQRVPDGFRTAEVLSEAVTEMIPVAMKSASVLRDEYLKGMIPECYTE
jgi:hypothetical protein